MAGSDTSRRTVGAGWQRASIVLPVSFKYVKVLVITRRLYRQQVEHGMENVVLLDDCGEFALSGLLRTGHRLVFPEMRRGPYQQRYCRSAYSWATSGMQGQWMMINVMVLILVR